MKKIILTTLTILIATATYANAQVSPIDAPQTAIQRACNPAVTPMRQQRMAMGCPN